MNVMNPMPAEPGTDNVEMFAHRRAAIDLIATLRARVTRVALFGANLFRAHPSQAEDEGTRTAWREALKEQTDGIGRTCDLLRGIDSAGQVTPDVARWLGTHGDENHEHRAGIERMRDMTDAVMRAVEKDDSAALEKALLVQQSYALGDFFKIVTELCENLWAQLDADRHAEVDQAAAAANAITKTLKRLELIGKHVRLVSLNASVEAARVGDAGRGLGVIAVEFKTLAEEIQHLATTARADISGMTYGAKGATRSTPSKGT